MLTHDATHGAHNKALFETWLARYGDLAVLAAKSLQPIWSLPRTKVAQFEGAYAAAVERVKAIAQQIGVALPASIA
jgi:propane monooxygenase small subunit